MTARDLFKLFSGAAVDVAPRRMRRWVDRAARRKQLAETFSRAVVDRIPHPLVTLAERWNDQDNAKRPRYPGESYAKAARRWARNSLRKRELVSAPLLPRKKRARYVLRGSRQFKRDVAHRPDRLPVVPGNVRRPASAKR